MFDCWPRKLPHSGAPLAEEGKRAPMRTRAAVMVSGFPNAFASIYLAARLSAYSGWLLRRCIGLGLLTAVRAMLRVQNEPICDETHARRRDPCCIETNLAFDRDATQRSPMVASLESPLRTCHQQSNMACELSGPRRVDIIVNQTGHRGMQPLHAADSQCRASG
jgi:hypothetical protein